MKSIETDALLARDVMGWREFHYHGGGPTTSDDSDIWFDPDHNGHCWKGTPFQFVDDYYDRMFHRWSPYTNIADAWEVLRHMWVEKKVWLCVQPYEGGWQVNIEINGMGEIVVHESETVAICHAVEKWLEAQDG